MAELKRERDALEVLRGHVKIESSARLDIHKTSPNASEPGTWKEVEEALRGHVKIESSARLDIRKSSPNASEPGTWKEVEQNAGIRQVETMMNGNCQATALAQALADDDLQAYPELLEEMVATLKRGIRVMALTNLEKQFPHQARREALTEVNRGWPKMSRPTSLKMFRQYLDEYASTPSNAEATLEMVPRKNWGCSDTLLVAANLLQRDIFVLGKDAMGVKGWQCTRFTFGTRTKDKEAFVKGLQYSLEISACIQLLVDAKKKAIDEELPMPIVLKYTNEHYSAYVHHGIPLQYPQELCSLDMEIDETAGEKEDGVQRSLVSEFISDEDSPSEEEYVAPDGSNEFSRSLVPYEDRKRVNTKREHVSTPNVKVRVRGATINHHNAAVPYKRGKHETGVATARTEVEADNKPPWVDQWNTFEQTWPTRTVSFPRADGSSEMWRQAAIEAPEALLESFRNFPFREKVLQLLNAETLTKWMESRRRECIVDGLESLAANSQSQGTKRWLESWSGRWSSAVTEKDIAAVENSKDDWDKLRSLKYGTDDLLHICDPNLRKMGAIHLLCAEMYAEEECALTGIEVAHDRSTPAKVRLHLNLMQKYTNYHNALSSSYQDVCWAQVRDFFVNAVAQIEGDDSQFN
ncbi:hypothetical protein PHMEG_00015082 [Phytophthora megakarya]|uniref:Uncharacterized protein n=1 Tax=Phytophthora megakarya TaxID=4795 RepID=A0A225W3S3_9STRA|nr:hypothetical protein PHMEG_00015082 [Phytophthora megakarya]